ncbi:hypothetical protein ACSS6N_20110 [Peribacillus frigoritolerans]|uniref:hypothetical protein n=1 Tax=Peribacillus frigoritolerans TaxID=450367 RepID=UPI003F856F3F
MEGICDTPAEKLASRDPQTLALMRLGSQSAERERVSEINWKFFCLQLEILKYFHQSGRLLHLYVFLHHLNVD